MKENMMEVTISPAEHAADDFDSFQAMRREIELRIKNAKAALEQGPTTPAFTLADLRSDAPGRDIPPPETEAEIAVFRAELTRQLDYSDRMTKSGIYAAKEQV